MKEFFYNIKCVWKYSKDEKMKIVIYFILSIFGVIASIIYPIISAKIIVNLTDNKIRQFVYMGIIFTSIVILNDIINFSKSMLYEKIFRKVYTNIQYNLGSEILKLTNKTLNENSSGVFIQRLVGDTRTISTPLLSLLAKFHFDKPLAQCSLASSIVSHWGRICLEATITLI